MARCVCLVRRLMSIYCQIFVDCIYWNIKQQFREIDFFCALTSSFLRQINRSLIRSSWGIAWALFILAEWDLIFKMTLSYLSFHHILYKMALGEKHRDNFLRNIAQLVWRWFFLFFTLAIFCEYFHQRREWLRYENNYANFWISFN